MKKTPNKIVFYDGDCGLCNRSVQLILKYERDHSIHFSALQSDFTKNYFEANNWALPEMDTFNFAQDGKLLSKSEAAFQVAKHLKFPLSWLRVFSILPQWGTDQVYNLVAKYRQKLVKSYCHLPTSSQRKRFF